MALTEAQKVEAIRRVANAARRLADVQTAVRLTHFETADALAAVKPDQPDLDLDLQQRMNRAGAAVLLDEGVSVSVQIVEPSAYFAWLGARKNTATARAGFHDPSREVRGAAALQLLGLPRDTQRGRIGAPPPSRRAGTPADQLIRAHLADDDEAFDDLVDELLEHDRSGVFAVALRKFAARYTQEAVRDFKAALMEAAQSVSTDGGVMQLRVMIGLASDGLPDCSDLAAGLGDSGAFAVLSGGVQEVRFLPAWRTLDAVLDLSPGAVRRVMLDIVAGREPADLPPAKQNDGPLALVGVVSEQFVHLDEGDEAGVDLAGILRDADGTDEDREEYWADDLDEDDPDEDDLDDDDLDDDEPDDILDEYDARMQAIIDAETAAFETWSRAQVAHTPGLDALLFPTGPSDLADEFDTFMAGLANRTSDVPVDLAELESFLESASAEGDAAVCQLIHSGMVVDLAVLAADGLAIDVRTLSARDLEALGESVTADLGRAAERLGLAFEVVGTV